MSTNKAPKPEHGYCPLCKANLDGGSIYQHFINNGYTHEKALEIAGNYGATETKGQWGREIGIYDMDLDRTVAYRCPDCGGEWAR